MAIRTMTEKERAMSPQKRMLLIKAGQQAELYGMAARDKDMKAAERHKARELELLAQAREME